MIDEPDYDDEADTEATAKDLTLNVSGVSVDELIRQVARHIIYSSEFDRAGFIKEIKQTITKRVDEALKEVIHAKAAELMEGKISEMLQPRDEYGQPKGQPFTLFERISKEFDAFMREKVDSNGSASGYGDKMDRVTWLIRQHATKDLKAAAEVEIKKVKTLAEAQVAAAVGQFISQNLVAPVTAAILPQK